VKIKYKALLFDCDGVLVDTEPLSIGTLHKMALEQDIPISLEYALQNYIGKALAEVFADLEKQGAQKLPRDFESEFRRRSFEAFEAKLSPIAGVKELLNQVDVPMAVASNGPRFKMELTLGITGLQGYFGPHIYSAYDLQKWKPLPDLYWHAAQKLQVDPQDCAVIEDSVSGIQAGIKGGFTVYGFCLESRKEEFAALGALPFQHMDELANLLR
jgi:HAD superfamily hydrolase (TIGR01509 family)